MTRRSKITALLLTLLGFGATAAEAQHPDAGRIELDVYELANGLQVILAPDPTSTAVAVNVRYDAGSRREPPGRSGFAHLFEHLMGEETANIERGQAGDMVLAAGGVGNANLTVDRTQYFATMPPDRYNLKLWIEAESMHSLRVTEESFRREVEVVKEERRWRNENAPYGMAQLQAWFYAPYDSVGCFAYAHSQIGSPDDLDAATLEEVQEFFDTYYVPNNATLTVVGAFDPAQARALIDQYFGGIPRGADPPPVQCVDPFRRLPVREVLHDANAQLPGVMWTYGAVPARHPDSDAILLLQSILTDGQSSRLFRRLVREEQAAVQVTGFSWERLDPGIVWLFAVANQGVEAATLERIMDEELTRIRTEGVDVDEMQRAKNRYRASTIRARQTVEDRSNEILDHNHLFGDPEAVNTRLDRLLAVTTFDIQRVANTYFVPENRAVVVILPGTGEAR